jgi:hypothetical protein
MTGLPQWVQQVVVGALLTIIGALGAWAAPRIVAHGEQIECIKVRQEEHHNALRTLQDNMDDLRRDSKEQLRRQADVQASLSALHTTLKLHMKEQP